MSLRRLQRDPEAHETGGDPRTSQRFGRYPSTDHAWGQRPVDEDAGVHREILGVNVTTSEDGAGWLSFWRYLIACACLGPAGHLRRPRRPDRRSPARPCPVRPAAVPHPITPRTLLAFSPRSSRGWVNALLIVTVTTGNLAYGVIVGVIVAMALHLRPARR
ncbi:hypothetical protein GCM10009616_11990 [Microlunatus lacustris]